VGFWDFVLGRQTTLDAVVSAHPILFEVDVPRELFGVETPGGQLSPAPKVTRKQAQQVGAVVKSRNLICGPLGTVPLDLLNRDNEVVQAPLLAQPEANVPRSVTMTRLFEDLFYDGIAWWQRVENDYRGYPKRVKRVKPDDITVSDGRIYLKGREVTNPESKLIRFDSPNPGILEAAARAIRTQLRLSDESAKAAEDPMPQGYFSPADGADPADDDDIVEMLLAWKQARQAGRTGYVPAALKYNTPAYSPKDLQLTEAQRETVLEVARHTGLDPEDLGISTTSRTYLNAQQKRIERLNDVLGPYATAVRDRLSMPDITPAGYAVRPDFSAYLMADDKTRLENYAAGIELGIYDLAYIARREGLALPDSPVVREAKAITEKAAA